MNDITALIERLRAHADCHAHVAQFDDEQKQWTEDLFAAADLILRLRASITELRDEARVAARDLTLVMGTDAVRLAYMLLAGRLDAILVNSHKEPTP